MCSARCLSSPDVPARQVRKIASLGSLARFEAKEPIVNAGDPGDAFYVILSGRAKVRRGQADVLWRNSAQVLLRRDGAHRRRAAIRDNRRRDGDHLPDADPQAIHQGPAWRAQRGSRAPGNARRPRSRAGGVPGRLPGRKPRTRSRVSRISHGGTVLIVLAITEATKPERSPAAVASATERSSPSCTACSARAREMWCSAAKASSDFSSRRREHQLLPRRPELAGSAVERRERDLLQHRLQAAGAPPLALHARVGDRRGLVRPAAECGIRHDDRRHRRDCDQQRRGASQSCSPRESATGTRAASARTAASKKGSRRHP